MGCCGNSGVVVVTGILVWVAFDLAVIALFAPFWYTIEIREDNDTIDASKGLVLACREPFDDDDSDCDWTLDDDWSATEDDVSDYGDNFRIVQILWFAATGLLALSAFWGFFLCCERCMNRCCPALLMVLLFIASGGAIAAVVLFGIDNGNKWDRGDEEDGYYDWAYYVAIATGAVGLLATLFAGISICKIRKSI